MVTTIKASTQNKILKKRFLFKNLYFLTLRTKIYEEKKLKAYVIGWIIAAKASS